MKRHLVAGLCATTVILTACPQEGSRKPQQTERAELRVLNGSTIEVAPTEGQLPYCLIFTITEAGKPPIIRQLTMTHENKSVPCEANRAIGGISYKIPVEEGKVRILTFFSSTKLSAGSIAQQIYELAANNPKWNTLDLRLPGQVFIETLEFDPQPDRPVSAGGVVGSTGTVQGAQTDATGSAPAEAGADAGQ